MPPVNTREKISLNTLFPLYLFRFYHFHSSCFVHTKYSEIKKCFPGKQRIQLHVWVSLSLQAQNRVTQLCVQLEVNLMLQCSGHGLSYFHK